MMRQQIRTRLTSDIDTNHLKFPVKNNGQQFNRYVDYSNRAVVMKTNKNAKNSQKNVEKENLKMSHKEDIILKRLEKYKNCKNIESDEISSKDSSVEDLYNNTTFGESYPSSLTPSINSSQDTMIEDQIEEIRRSLHVLTKRFINERKPENETTHEKRHSKKSKSHKRNGSGDKHRGKEKTNRSNPNDMLEILEKCERERERCYQRIEANMNNLKNIDKIITQFRSRKI
jgi:hypothetical protein